MRYWNEDEFNEYYKDFDLDGNGTVNKEEMEKFVRKVSALGPKWGTPEYEEMKIQEKQEKMKTQMQKENLQRLADLATEHHAKHSKPKEEKEE